MKFLAQKGKKLSCPAANSLIVRRLSTASPAPFNYFSFYFRKNYPLAPNNYLISDSVNISHPVNKTKQSNKF